MKKIIVVIMLIGFSFSLFASGISLSGVGARAISMGGAMRGLADDYTAMYWNPAGLSYMEENTIALALAGINHQGEIENSGNKYENDNHTYAFPNLYYVKKAETKFNYGLGVYVPYGLGSQWDMMQATNHYQPSELSVVTADGTEVGTTPVEWSDDFDEYDTKAEISMVDIHPSISYKLTDCFSVGMGLSIVYGNIKLIKTSVSSSLVDLQNGTYLVNLLPTSMDMEGDGIAIGGNFGFMYKPDDKLRIGLSGKLPMTMTLEGDADILLLANNYTSAHPNLEMGINKSTSDVEAELNLPADIGLGASYYVKENWLFAADFTYTLWESFDKAPIEFDGIDPSGAELNDRRILMEWDNVIRFSVGTEYTYNQMMYRFGYYYDQSPIPKETLGPTWPDISDKSSFNIGFGYDFGKFQVDAGYEYITFPEIEVEEANISDDGSLENYPGTYNAYIQAFNIGLAYKF